MNETLNRLFGLDALGFGAPDAALVFERPLPAWAWAALCVVALALALWTYRNLPASTGARAALGVTRALLIILLALLASGPSLRLEQVRTERDRVFILVDRSASMRVPDGPAPPGATTGQSGVTRAMQAADALARARPAFKTLARRSDLSFFAFGSNTRPTTPGEIPPADDHATRLGDALATTLESARGAPIGGIILLTDGRATDAIAPATLRRLEAERVPVFPVPLGSTDPVRSVSIDQAESPGVAFAQDTVPVRARVAWSGDPPLNLTAQLVDRATNRVLDQAPVPIGPEARETRLAWVTLTTTPPQAGSLDLEVRLSCVRADTDPKDNSARTPIRVVDRPIRVLYIDGHPRWQQRYLKNLLIREPTIDATAVLLAPGRNYAQDGDTLIPALPVTAEEWDRFDVVIIGDVSGELFGAEQLTRLTEHIARRGAGVLWLAGPGATPQAWFDTPAADLLPLRPGAPGPWAEPVTMRATNEAARLGVLLTSDDGRSWNTRLSDPDAGWTRLRWALRLDPPSLKPGVSVLAEAIGVRSGHASPIVVTMRFGAGRAALVATDEIWRWRYGRGETLTERFWIPLIRSLARGRVASALGPGALTVKPQHPMPGTPALIELEVFDQSIIDRLPDRVHARVVRADASESIVTLRGEGAFRSGVWTPDTPGAVVVGLLPDAPSELGALSADALVIEPGDERRNLNTDHQLLAELAQRTGGRVVPSDQTHRLADWVPNRSRAHAANPVIETLWDRWIVLIVVVALCAIEWTGRRLCRLP